MNDHDALLAAVIANPDEDTPRLVMADWFDENGESDRAEFVRVQVELAKWEEPSPFEHDAGGCEVIRGRRDELRRRERELLDGFNRDKVDCCPRAFPGFRLVGLDVGWYRGLNTLGEVRRGFVECVTCTAEDWLADGDAVRAAQPVTRVTFAAPPGEFAELTVGPFDGSYSYRVAGKTVKRYADEPEDATFLFARRWPGVWFGTYHVGLHVIRYYRVADDESCRGGEVRDVTRERPVAAAT